MTGPTAPRTLPAPAPAAGRRGESSDSAVLDAAAASLLSVGVRRTTATDVARRAGISRMTLYRRWPDLRALVGDVMTREWGRIVTAAARAAEPSLAAGTRAGLVRYLVAAARAFRANPLFRKITETDPELLVPYVLERLGATQRLVLELLCEQLRAAQAGGAVRAGDPAAQARMVLLIVQSYVLSAGALGDEITEEALARELHLTLDGYLAPRAGEAAETAEAAVDEIRPIEHPGAPS
ncbi:TetR/AcrR family transcriptional regulator [Parafrankia discariae]|uniref:TetR/AcrR family transcriptional regulator n=1 Tax=Parafrankia discariae TaxID=365528 RepID=UPI00037BB3E6|nr:TetR/AcrR family transcriptional regulator [Parafrankia discariae]